MKSDLKCLLFFVYIRDFISEDVKASIFPSYFSISFSILFKTCLKQINREYFHRLSENYYFF